MFFSHIVPESYRIGDLSSRLYPASGNPVGSFGVFQNLDRFALTFKLKSADVIIGRQAIAWGSARIINPTDVIAPFTFNELDKEERFGVDAVRLRVPLGELDELDIGYIAGKDLEWSKSAFFLRGKGHILKTDLSMILMAFREHGLFGIDLARSIGGAGFWTEAAYVVPYLFKPSLREENRSYFRASVGSDYNFSQKLYGYCEYYFNSGGNGQPRDYTQFLTSAAFRDGAVYLLGRHYFGVGLVYEISPLIPATAFFFYNLTDGSFTLAPQVEYNIDENIYVSAGAYISVGKAPTLSPRNGSGPGLRFGSEFGSYPDVVYVAFRIYF